MDWKPFLTYSIEFSSAIKVLQMLTAVYHDLFPTVRCECFYQNMLQNMISWNLSNTLVQLLVYTCGQLNARMFFLNTRSHGHLYQADSYDDPGLPLAVNRDYQIYCLVRLALDQTYSYFSSYNSS